MVNSFVETAALSGSDRALLLRIVGSYCSKEKKKEKNQKKKFRKGGPKESKENVVDPDRVGLVIEPETLIGHPVDIISCSPSRWVSGPSETLASGSSQCNC